MKLILFAAILSLLSCTDASSNKKRARETKTDSLRLQLIGKWGGLGEDSPVWEITADSIHFFGAGETFPWKLSGADLIINRNGPSLIFSKVSVIRDTMIFFNEDTSASISSYRFK